MVIVLTEDTIEETNIIFVGNSFKSIVEEMGKEKVDCLPMIYRRESIVGLMIKIKDCENFLFVEGDTDDPFRAYRVMRVISNLETININLMGAAFLATDRTKELSILGFSPPLSNMIKWRDLVKIMMELVPEEIVQSVIGKGTKLSNSDKWILKQELLAETILYNERIAKLEIKEPREIAQEIESFNFKCIKAYIRIEAILDSYFSWFEEELKEEIIQEILELVMLEKFNLSDELAVALGGFIAQMKYYDSLSAEVEEESFTGMLFRDRANEITIASIYWLAIEKNYSFNEAAKDLDDILYTIINFKEDE